MTTTLSYPLALIIEDDQDLVDIFASALQNAQYTTETVQDGQAALKRLSETEPAIVVLDLHLPHVSGEKILHYIRGDERLAQTRVMLATADPLLAEKLRSEVDLVLIKPISFSQLRDLSARLRPADLTA